MSPLIQNPGKCKAVVRGNNVVKGQERVSIVKWCEKTFQDDGAVQQLDFGGGYVITYNYQNLSTCVFKMSEFCCM